MIPVKKLKILCSICGKPDWCLIAEDGSTCICARVSEGAVRRAGDGGWLHKLGGEHKPYVKYKPESRSKIDFWKLAHDYSRNLSSPDVLAKELGVSAKSLTRLGVGFDGSMHTFPMSNGHDKIVGIRRRGKNCKLSVLGSKNGLFWPAGLKKNSQELLFLPEGPTDTAALLDLGFEAIGRPSCNSGTKDIIIMLNGNLRPVVIVADRDTPKYRPDGSVFYPGQEGGFLLAKLVKPIVGQVRVIYPPKGRDMRAWLLEGATKAIVMAVVNNARFL